MKYNTYSVEFEIIFPREQQKNLTKTIIRMVFRMRKKNQKIDKNL